jgi:hypothetical protein
MLPSFVRGPWESSHISKQQGRREEDDVAWTSPPSLRPHHPLALTGTLAVQHSVFFISNPFLHHRSHAHVQVQFEALCVHFPINILFIPGLKPAKLPSSVPVAFLLPVVPVLLS